MKRAAHFNHLASLMPELIQRLSWDRSAIEHQQLSAWRDMLRHVRRHSPWHAERTRHLDPETATLADLASVPPMTKQDLMENWDRIVTVPGATLEGAKEILRESSDQTYLWGDNVLLASGGTGGQPGLFLYDWNAMALNWGSMSRSMVMTVVERAGSPRMLRQAVIAAEKSAHGSYVMSTIFGNPDNPPLRLSSWRTLDEIFEPLNAFQPQLISCYPTHIPGLAAATRAGRLGISPVVMHFGSEHLSEANRRLALETWPESVVFTNWGTSEGGATFPCPLGGFHVSEDLVVLEPIDGAGDPVPIDGRSESVYLTNLFNKALPIIRYHIDDIFEMAGTSCGCGSRYQKVDQVLGRGFEKFVYGDVAVHPLAIELGVIEQSNVLEYQIRQTVDGVQILYRSEGELDLERMNRKVRSAFESYGLREMTIDLTKVDCLARTSAGKMRRFVPLASQ